jgi:hypothetical protein
METDPTGGDALSCRSTAATQASEIITTQQAADRLGLTTNALYELRCCDDGLPIFQKGFTVGYPTLKAWGRYSDCGTRSPGHAPKTTQY